VYVIRGLPEVRRILAWHDDLEVVTFSTITILVVANTGDGEVFLSNLSLRAEGGGRYQTFIPLFDLVVPAGSIVSHKFNRAKDLGPATEGGKPANVVANLEDEKWTDVARRVLRSTDKCYVAEYFLQTDPSYHQILETFGNGVRTLKANGSLHFWSVKKSRMLEKPMAVVALVFRRHDSQCKE
jgi:hypothetical protein